MKNNENYSLCSSCRGLCCKRYPGLLHPDQLDEITEESLTKLVESGFQFDYWEGNLTGYPEHDNIRFYFVRPATVRSRGKIIDASWGGQCTFLTNEGCTFKFEDRPQMCQDLEPIENLKCKLKEGALTKEDYVMAWLPYNSIIENVINN